MDQPEVDILTRVSVNDEPLSYPGRIEAGSDLLCGTRVSSLSFATNRRLGQSMVLPYGERPGVGEAHDFTRLNYQLLIDNAASIDRRMPVVAIGSNAAARQLYDKLVRAGASTTVPVVKAGLHGIAIAASAHVSDPGYIAVAPTQHPDKDACVEVFVAFLDQRQVNVVDASERNYERVCLSGDHYRLELDSGEVLGSFYVYRTRRGVIADSWRLLQPLTDSQPRLIRELLEGYTLGDELDIGSPEQFPKDMSGNSEQRRRFTEALKRRGLVVPDGLDASQQGTPQLTYGDIETNLQRLSIEQREAGYRWVDRTPDTLRRDGDHCIAITTAQANELGVKVYAQVSHRVYDREIAVIAKVIRLDVEVGDHDRVLLDQAVRNGIGIEIRERVLIRPARVPSGILGDLLLGRRKYLLARSQRADLSTMESGICALPAVDLGVLGVAPGDEVILEGPVDEHRRARYCKLKAHAAPEHMLERRERLSGGGLDSRFPAARDAIGVFPDLPWVFLDSASRRQLSLGQLFPVRVRASRRYQVLKELRESLLLFILAGVGLAVSIRQLELRLVLLGCLFALTVLIVGVRLRGRLR